MLGGLSSQSGVRLTMEPLASRFTAPGAVRGPCGELDTDMPIIALRHLNTRCELMGSNIKLYTYTTSYIMNGRYVIIIFHNNNNINTVCNINNNDVDS